MKYAIINSAEMSAGYYFKRRYNMNAEKEKLWDKICSYRPKEKNKVEPKQWLIVHAVITSLTLLGLLFQFEYSNAYIFAFWGVIYFNVTIDFMLWFFSNPPSDSLCNKIFTLLFLVMFLPLFIAVLIKEIYQLERIII